MTEKYEPLCTRCKTLLIFNGEFEDGICEDCANYYIGRSQRQAEWDHYHPGEPAPECELEP
jgi:hypothetical protein